MIIAEINYSGNEKIYLNLAKNKIRTKFDLYKKLLQDIINQFTEEHIYEAIDTLYLVDRKIFCPTNGFYGQGYQENLFLWGDCSDSCRPVDRPAVWQYSR